VNVRNTLQIVKIGVIAYLVTVLANITFMVYGRPAQNATVDINCKLLKDQHNLAFHQLDLNLIILN